MIDVKEATKIIHDHLKPVNKVSIPIEKAMGRVLQESVLADTDFPPFDRVMMDGIAVRFDDYKNGCRNFKIKGVQAAGAPQAELAETNSCLEIMTGAVLSKGADTVIPYEHIEINKEKQTATIIEEVPEKGKNIHVKGMDKKTGDLLVESGRVISAAEIAIMASVGKTEILVSQNPRVAIISTGDELVEINEKPLPHQIRRSNIYALQAECNKLGLAVSLFHINDEEDVLREELRRIIEEHDVLLMSGGVSMGKFDFIPKILSELKIEKHFHKIRQKPGKPFWFGTGMNSKYVFAFPGNPVSTFMCFHRYFIPWFYESMGVQCQLSYAVLEENFEFKGPLTYFLQVRTIVNEDARISALPMRGRGSGDHANLIDANGFIELPSDRNLFKKGEAFQLYNFR